MHGTFMSFPDTNDKRTRSVSLSLSLPLALLLCMVHEKKAPSSRALCGRSSSTSPQVAATRVVMRCNEVLAACDQHEHTATSHPPHMCSKYFGSSKHHGKSSMRLVYCNPPPPPRSGSNKVPTQPCMTKMGGTHRYSYQTTLSR